jgi:serine/threonine protein kinase/Tol biopolymer transport system component
VAAPISSLPLTLAAGRKLGPYEIVSLIGAGGMGEVYRARDTRLARTVAIKVLSSNFTATATHRARFEREARAIAALSHSNICAIHDVGSEDGTEYLVMEFLEGETLADRIARGPLPINLVLRYGLQIAEALQQAHRAGITHRDLKPGNIMITATGIKLLDFGLAKTITAPDSASLQSDMPTEAEPLTAEGSIVGTLQYMAPEQIEGKAVDHRADIFALGVILYEMITGRRAFSGASQTAIAASILSSNPPSVRSLQPTTPPAIERIIITALEKNADDRWQTAHDVARQLRWMIDASASGEDAAAEPAKRRFTGVFFLILLLLAAAALTWSALRFAHPSPADAGSLTRLEFAPPKGIIPSGNFDLNTVAISPDGKTICFLGSTGPERALYLRDLASYEVRKVEGSEASFAPFWSPDGRWIGFSARGKLWKTKRSGDTPPEPLCEVGEAGAMGTWADHTILFGETVEGRASIYRVDDSGGRAVPITHPSSEEWRHTQPYFLPDGQHFVYQAPSARTNDVDLVLATLDGTKKGVLLKNVSFVRSSANDQLMYVRDGKLLAQRFDTAKATLVGEAVTVADDAAYFYPTGTAHFDAVPSGLVVYRTNTRNDRLSIVDRRGVEKKLLDDQGLFFDLRVSPDSTKAAVTVTSRGTGVGDIWLYDLARAVRDRFTSDPGMEYGPLWSGDGRWLFYSTANGGTVPYIVRRAVDGTTTVGVTARGLFRWAGSFSPDGDTLYFVDRNPRTKTDIYRMSMRTLKPEAMMASEFYEGDPQVSPDGKWLAYSADISGNPEVYLQSLSDGGARRIRVSTQGGLRPRWKGDSTELFYLSADRRGVFAVRTASGHWDDAKAEPLFTTRSDMAGYDVLPDGESFVIIQTTPGPSDNLFHVILGWH